MRKQTKVSPASPTTSPHRLLCLEEGSHGQSTKTATAAPVITPRAKHIALAAADTIASANHSAGPSRFPRNRIAAAHVASQKALHSIADHCVAQPRVSMLDHGRPAVRIAAPCALALNPHRLRM